MFGIYCFGIYLGFGTWALEISEKQNENVESWISNLFPVSARLIELLEMGHWGQHYLSVADAFAEKQTPFDPKIIRTMTDWLKQQEKLSQ